MFIDRDRIGVIGAGNRNKFDLFILQDQGNAQTIARHSLGLAREFRHALIEIIRIQYRFGNFGRRAFGIVFEADALKGQRQSKSWALCICCTH